MAGTPLARPDRWHFNWRQTMETNKNPGDEVPPETDQSGKLPCAACDGSGVKDGKPCPDCGGTGEITVLVGDA
jgi:hypothetical protein